MEPAWAGSQVSPEQISLVADIAAISATILPQILPLVADIAAISPRPPMQASQDASQDAPPAGDAPVVTQAPASAPSAHGNFAAVEGARESQLLIVKAQTGQARHRPRTSSPAPAQRALLRDAPRRPRRARHTARRLARAPPKTALGGPSCSRRSLRCGRRARASTLRRPRALPRATRSCSQSKARKSSRRTSASTRQVPYDGPPTP